MTHHQKPDRLPHRLRETATKKQQFSITHSLLRRLAATLMSFIVIAAVFATMPIARRITRAENPPFPCSLVTDPNNDPSTDPRVDRFVSERHQSQNILSFEIPLNSR